MEQCPDCEVKIGQLHLEGCDQEDCPYCGLQALTCEHAGSIPMDDRMPWQGCRKMESAAVKMNWYARLGAPGQGWISCDKHEFGAWPDLNRVVGEMRWSRDLKEFVPPS